MSRKKAFSIHFAISLLLFFVLSLLILFVWYPIPYFYADGGWQGIRIVAAVDVVLGPLLTLLFFNPQKLTKELFTDMSCIALVQIVALTWGVWTVYNQRPVVTAFEDNVLRSVTMEHYTKQSINTENLLEFGERLPVMVFVKKPTDIHALQQIHKNIVDKKLPSFAQFDLYEHFGMHFDEVQSRGLDIAPIIVNQPEMQQSLKHFLSQQNKNQNDYLYLPFKGRYHSVIMMLDKQTQTVVHSLRYRQTSS